MIYRHSGQEHQLPTFDQMEIIKWPESELNGLLKMDFAKDRGKSEIKTNFIIPMIVYQLKQYHPNCNKEIGKATKRNRLQMGKKRNKDYRQQCIKNRRNRIEIEALDF